MKRLVVAGKVKDLNDLLPPKGNEGITLYMYAEIPEQMEQAESEPVAAFSEYNDKVSQMLWGESEPVAWEIWRGGKPYDVTRRKVVVDRAIEFGDEVKPLIYTTPQPVAPCPTCESVRARLHVLIDRAEYKELQAKCAELEKERDDWKELSQKYDEDAANQLQQHQSVLKKCEKAMRLYFDRGITESFYYEVREALASIKALREGEGK